MTINHKKGSVSALLVAGIALVLAAIAVVVAWRSNSVPNISQGPAHLGAVGGLLAENYMPYVMYNGGYNSAKDLTISGVTTLSGATSLTSTLTVGSSGTALNRVNTGICYLRPTASTIAASSTQLVDCQGTAAVKNPSGTAGSVASALPGVTLGDFVQVTLSTTTGLGGTTAGSFIGGLSLLGASASTTAGYINLIIANLSGTIFTWPVAGAASGTASYLVTN